MARPKKCRRVCCLPANDTFGPQNTAGSSEGNSDEIIMSVEEYETIRLIDLLQYTQEECGQYMMIARTTVQSIYNDARQKLAHALVEGKTLKIRGGNYCLCNGDESQCGFAGCCHCCCKRRMQMQQSPEEEKTES